jgi:hypothetical protein
MPYAVFVLPINRLTAYFWFRACCLGFELLPEGLVESVNESGELLTASSNW